MDLESLNQAQLEAVEHDQGPALVLAGAGTGKTHLITSRIGHLALNKKVPLDRIIALTFTDKAAREMEERVDSMMPYGMVDTRITTFHSFGEQLLAQYGHDLGLPLNLKLLTKSQQIVYLRQNIDKLHLDYYAPVGDPASYLGSLSSYFSRLSDELITEQRYQEYIDKLEKLTKTTEVKLEIKRHQELHGAFKAYRNLKRQQGMIDYDDQVGLIVELFENRPNVLKQVISGFDYLMVDEFQDTNRAQNRLLQLLAGSSGNLMVVGDDDQSIYRFRGARVANILEFDQFFVNPKRIVLTENYRSTQQVLDNAYRLIQHNNPDRLEAQQGLSKYLVSQVTGPESQVWVLPTYSLEADAIAKNIAERLKAGQSPDSIAVLLRKKNQSDGLLYALRRHQVPYRFSDSQSLYEQSEVMTLIQFLQVLTDPSDSGSLYHLLASDVVNINFEFLMTQTAHARKQNLSLEQKLRDIKPEEVTDQGTPLINFFSDLDKWRQQSKSLTAGQILFEFCDTTGLIKKLVQSSNDNPADALKVQNIGRFFAIASDFEQVAIDRSAMAFAIAISDLREAGEEPEVVEPDSALDEVRVMTVHKSKGLEFETVYLFDLVKGTLPATNRRVSIALPDELLGEGELDRSLLHLQEERRLMYVAMTRAKTDLIMTYSPDHGGKLAKKPSPFIQEAIGIEPPALEKGGVAGRIEESLHLFKVAPQKVPTANRSDTITLTPHQIDDYLSCPANFHYRHVLMVPEPPVPALMYGTLIHEAIKRYFVSKRLKTLTLEPLLGLVDSMWRSDGFISKGQEQKRKQQAVETIKSFYNREEAANENPSQVERSFEVGLDDIDVVVRGRIDAVFERKNGVEIRDFKTSAVDNQKKADTKAKGSVQLMIYALAWHQLTGNLPVKLTLDYVDTGLTGSYTPTMADLEKIKYQISKVAQGIRSGEFTPSGNCFYCSHPKLATEAQ
jgi:DNA helicase II / ATP-dependent DNA helicase PcrA